MPTSPLAFLSANVQGLCPAKGKFKLRMIEEKVGDENIGVMIFTETHLSEDHLDAETHIRGYDQFRSNRNGNAKRGVCLCS